VLVVVYSVVLLALAAGSGAFDDGDSEAGAIVDLVLGAIFLLLGTVAVFSKESPRRRPRRANAFSARPPRGSAGCWSQAW
jgi:hypothetical protein